MFFFLHLEAWNNELHGILRSRNSRPETRSVSGKRMGNVETGSFQSI